MKKEGQKLRIEVTDNASGIPADILNDLFKQKVPSYKDGGTGLGLWTVGRELEAADGTVSIQSQDDKGTRITVTLPLVKAATEAPSAPKESYEAQMTYQEARALTVMVIDDNPAVLASTEQNLGRLGFDVISYNNPIEAMTVYREMEEKPQIVLVDETMPEMPGHRLVEELTSHEAAKGSRFAMYSGNLMEETIRRLNEQGIPVGFIPKGGDLKRFRYEITKIGREIIDSLPEKELERRMSESTWSPFPHTPVSLFLRRLIHKLNNQLMFSANIDFMIMDYEAQGRIEPADLKALKQGYQEFRDMVQSFVSFTESASILDRVSEIGETNLPESLFVDDELVQVWEQVPAKERYKFAVVTHLYLTSGVLDSIEALDGLFSESSLSVQDLEEMKEACNEITRVNFAAQLSYEDPEERERFKNYFELLAKLGDFRRRN